VITSLGEDPGGLGEEVIEAFVVGTQGHRFRTVVRMVPSCRGPGKGTAPSCTAHRAPCTL